MPPIQVLLMYVQIFPLPFLYYDAVSRTEQPSNMFLSEGTLPCSVLEPSVVSRALPFSLQILNMPTMLFLLDAMSSTLKIFLWLLNNHPIPPPYMNTYTKINPHGACNIWHAPIYFLHGWWIYASFPFQRILPIIQYFENLPLGPFHRPIELAWNLIIAPQTMHT